MINNGINTTLCIHAQCTYTRVRQPTFKQYVFRLLLAVIRKNKCSLMVTPWKITVLNTPRMSLLLLDTNQRD